MSTTRQSGSPSQPSPAKEAPTSKKAHQKRAKRGQKSVTKERLAPISKYLVKEEPPRESDATPSNSKADACGSSTTSAVVRTNDNPADLSKQPEPKSPKTEDRAPKTRQRGRESSNRAEASASSSGKLSQAKKKESGAVRKRESGQQSSSGRGGGGGGGRGERTEPQRSGNTRAVRKQVQTSIRDHFPVRRSGRKTKSEIEREEYERMAQRLRQKDESGLEVVEVDGKGRGVVSTRPFSRGELVCEYSGELISLEEAQEREEEYGRDSTIGCYMYYFSHKDRKLCVDATADNGRKGRLLNHSRTAANVVTRLLEVDSQPYLCLVAARDISVGEELEYDYGERDRAAMDSHPWLAT